MPVTFAGITVEQRVDDDLNRGKFNVYEDSKERKEYFSRTHNTKSSRKNINGRSLNKSKWQITEHDNDKKSERTDAYGDHSLQSVLMDFGVDATPLLRNKPVKSSAKSVKKPAKKKSAKKSTKKGGKKKSSKKSKKKSKGKKKGG
jgi:hypothetical protein